MADLYASLKNVADGLLRDFGASMVVSQTNPVNGTISQSTLLAVQAGRAKATDDQGVPIGDWDYVTSAPIGFKFKTGDKFTFAGSDQIVMFASELKPAATAVIWQMTSRLG